MATIATPIGRVEISFTADCSAADADAITRCLEIIEYAPRLPATMSVLGCRAAIACVTPSATLRDVVFCARLNASQKVTGGAETGESLDAIGIRSDSHVVLVGTEDADCLHRRLDGSVMFPEEPPPLTDNSVTVRLLKAVAGKTLSLHFLVAWNHLPEPEECSCWYAVDQDHSAVLSAWRANQAMEQNRDRV